MKTIAVIPARFNSTRFPGKPLSLINGQPMFYWVYQAALTCTKVDKVFLATDDDRILDKAISYGCNVILTRLNCPSGTDRVYEVATGQKLASDDIILNLQGDEPLVQSSHIESLIIHLSENPRSRIATLAVPINYQEALDVNVVKVVKDHSNRALYFSRLPVPYNSNRYLKHIGIYAYRMEALGLLCALPQADIEINEKLEQLRALDHGIGIDIVLTDQNTVSVDTPQDIQRVEEHLRQRIS